MKNFRVYFLRCGETEWDTKGLFPGWINTNLTKEGKANTIAKGWVFVNSQIFFDVIYTSMLDPTREVADLIYEEYVKKKEIRMVDSKKPIIEDWRLNERHFGDLIGYNKNDMIKKYGPEKIEKYLRTFNESPPVIEENHQYYNEIMMNPKWDIDFLRDIIPTSESFKMTCLRVASIWEEVIAPLVKRKKKILIVSHGFCLRALVKYIARIPERNILHYFLPKGRAFYYDFDTEMRPIGNPMPIFISNIDTSKSRGSLV